MDAQKRHVASLWAGVLIGPAAFAIDLEARYALVHYTCVNHAAWVMWLITIATLALTLFGLLCSWWGYVGAGFSPSRFMAISGFFIGGMFALAIVAMAIPDLLMRACD
jgi:hypothetical protein